MFLFLAAALSKQRLAFHYLTMGKQMRDNIEYELQEAQKQQEIDYQSPYDAATYMYRFATNSSYNLSLLQHPGRAPSANSRLAKQRFPKESGRSYYTLTLFIYGWADSAWYLDWFLWLAYLHAVNKCSSSLWLIPSQKHTEGNFCGVNSHMLSQRDINEASSPFACGLSTCIRMVIHQLICCHRQRFSLSLSRSLSPLSGTQIDHLLPCHCFCFFIVSLSLIVPASDAWAERKTKWRSTDMFMVRNICERDCHPQTRLFHWLGCLRNELMEKVIVDSWNFISVKDQQTLTKGSSKYHASTWDRFFHTHPC